MGLTSCRWVTIAKTLARRRRECAAGIMPVAVSLSNAPPTATPSSVMGLVQDGTASVGVGAAQHHVGVEHLAEDVLVAHVTKHPSHGHPQAKLVEMAADDIHLGECRGGVKVAGGRANDPPDIRGGVEQVAIDDDDLIGRSGRPCSRVGRPCSSLPATPPSTG
jgi:hypothetical protein